MKLQDKILEDLSLHELNNLLKGGKVYVNCFGGKMISVKGYNGSADLGYFAEQIMYFVKKRAECEFSLEERKAGYEAVNRVKKFYFLADCQLEKSLLKQIMNAARRVLGLDHGEKCVLPLSQRLFIEDSFAPLRFLGFTAEQFKRAFPDEPFPDRTYETSSTWGKLYVAEPELIGCVQACFSRELS